MKIFLSVFLAIIAAFAVIRVWDAYGVGALVFALAVFLVTLILVQTNYWRKGYYGLDQWPYPHGRYYERWLSLKDCKQDYYPWLELEMIREREERKTARSIKNGVAQ